MLLLQGNRSSVGIARESLAVVAEVIVRLPLILASKAPLPLPSPSIETAAPPGKLHRVLVVDDNVDAAQSLAMLLQAFGHDVRLAHDGPAAVLILAANFLLTQAFFAI